MARGSTDWRTWTKFPHSVRDDAADEIRKFAERVRLAGNHVRNRDPMEAHQYRRRAAALERLAEDIAAGESKISTERKRILLDAMRKLHRTSPSIRAILQSINEKEVEI